MKTIPGHPHYLATEDGRIWSMRRKRFLKTCVAKRSGYLRVALSDDTYFLHFLICLAFHGERPSTKHQVRHRDRNKSNCHEDNLRWGIAKDNSDDREAHGMTRRGETHTNAKLTNVQVKSIRRVYAAGNVSQRSLAVRFRVAQYQIWAVVNRITWKHIK